MDSQHAPLSVLKLLKKGQRVQFTSCDNPSVNERASFWSLPLSRRTGTVIGPNVYFKNKIYVCFALDNPAGPQTAKEIEYFSSSHHLLPNDTACGMLVERKALTDGVVKIHSEDSSQSSSNQVLSTLNLSEPVAAVYAADVDSVNQLKVMLQISEDLASNLLEVYGDVGTALENYEDFILAKERACFLQDSNVSNRNEDEDDDGWGGLFGDLNTDALEVSRSDEEEPNSTFRTTSTMIPLPGMANSWSSFPTSSDNGLRGTSNIQQPVTPVASRSAPDLVVSPEGKMLAEIISGPGELAMLLLSRYGNDVEESVTHYYGMSSTQQIALAAEATRMTFQQQQEQPPQQPPQSALKPSSASSFLTPQQTVDSLLTPPPRAETRGTERLLKCGKCNSNTFHFNSFENSWSCDHPDHVGGRVAHPSQETFYCCENLHTCDHMICKTCFQSGGYNTGTPTAKFRQLVETYEHKKSEKQDLSVAGLIPLLESAVEETKITLNGKDRPTLIIDNNQQTDIDSKPKAVPFAIVCLKCKIPVEEKPMCTWDDGWTCDLPSHCGMNGFPTHDPVYGCPTIRTCNWGVCQTCFNAHANGATNKHTNASAMPPKGGSGEKADSPVMSLLPPPPPPPPPRPERRNCSRCDRVVGLDSKTLTRCGHTVCNSCLSKHLSASRRLRPNPTAAHHPQGVTLMNSSSLFLFRGLPPLPVPANFDCSSIIYFCEDIACPVLNCKHCVTENDVHALPEYVQDMLQSEEECRQIVSEMRTYRTCCFMNIMRCADGPQPVSHFISLGCNCFFHYDCLTPALRTSIEKERAKKDTAGTKPQPIVCPNCEKSDKDTTCYCPPCMGRAVHVITDQEIRGLVECVDCDFSAQDRENWDNNAFLASFSTEVYLEGEKTVCCPGCGETYTASEELQVVQCVNGRCNMRICVQCEKAAHSGKTCAQAASEARSGPAPDWEAIGVLIQYCPSCDTAGDRPPAGACLHITCACGEQFCFLCAAPHTPNVAHSAAYHRPECSLYTECCEKKCIDNGAATCVESVYYPGPCSACFNKPGRHNSCTHTPKWKACATCVKSQSGVVNCMHYCGECRKLGMLCSPPGNPLSADGSSKKHRIIARDLVLKLEKEEIAAGKKGHR